MLQPSPLVRDQSGMQSSSSLYSACPGVSNPPSLFIFLALGTLGDVLPLSHVAASLLTEETALDPCPAAPSWSPCCQSQEGEGRAVHVHFITHHCYSCLPSLRRPSKGESLHSTTGHGEGDGTRKRGPNSTRTLTVHSLSFPPLSVSANSPPSERIREFDEILSRVTAALQEHRGTTNARGKRDNPQPLTGCSDEEDPVSDAAPLHMRAEDGKKGEHSLSRRGEAEGKAAPPPFLFHSQSVSSSSFYVSSSDAFPSQSFFPCALSPSCRPLLLTNFFGLCAFHIAQKEDLRMVILSPCPPPKLIPKNVKKQVETEMKEEVERLKAADREEESERMRQREAGREMNRSKQEEEQTEAGDRGTKTYSGNLHTPPVSSRTATEKRSEEGKKKEGLEKKGKEQPFSKRKAGSVTESCPSPSSSRLMSWTDVCHWAWRLLLDDHALFRSRLSLPESIFDPPVPNSNGIRERGEETRLRPADLTQRHPSSFHGPLSGPSSSSSPPLSFSDSLFHPPSVEVLYLLSPLLWSAFWKGKRRGKKEKGALGDFVSEASTGGGCEGESDKDLPHSLESWVEEHSHVVGRVGGVSDFLLLHDDLLPPGSPLRKREPLCLCVYVSFGSLGTDAVSAYPSERQEEEKEMCEGEKRHSKRRKTSRSVKVLPSLSSLMRVLERAGKELLQREGLRGRVGRVAVLLHSPEGRLGDSDKERGEEIGDESVGRERGESVEAEIIEKVVRRLQGREEKDGLSGDSIEEKGEARGGKKISAGSSSSRKWNALGLSSETQHDMTSQKETESSEEQMCVVPLRSLVCLPRLLNALQTCVSPLCIAVTHGGAGTVAEVLERGIPLVAVPLVFDQQGWGGAVEALGVGTVGGDLGECLCSLVREEGEEEEEDEKGEEKLERQGGETGLWRERAGEEEEDYSGGITRECVDGMRRQKSREKVGEKMCASAFVDSLYPLVVEMIRSEKRGGEDSAGSRGEEGRESGCGEMQTQRSCEASAPVSSFEKRYSESAGEMTSPHQGPPEVSSSGCCPEELQRERRDEGDFVGGYGSRDASRESHRFTQMKDSVQNPSSEMKKLGTGNLYEQKPSNKDRPIKTTHWQSLERPGEDISQQAAERTSEAQEGEQRSHADG
uniref:Glycosyl transferase family 28 C-terminal domain-containing protein n=1 Tax=Chromera velia CCMP2878 TaxID=1169474 RepID=A0A0G4HYG3_9ALVE|eukprot:Cvel_9489.t1-p1 / transcript=Cvel_9489.t1 / gene=Cvel_9489 / organism=Chromera_velia_CCMP2878 / gene_product=hypothetical protein / transcript_product=hypothetical protein / location=Cvel_scaffold548:34548-43748(-) / protein_length=1125 / sequence_SO=supercontig / SO=protein_coding / is_pseudo=false